MIDDENRTSERVSSDGVYSYTYDANGNILTVSKGGALKAKYTYDSLNQLVREDIAGAASYVYAYTSNGNITSATRYAYTTGTLGTAISTVNYGYLTTDVYPENSQDVLCSYNGSSVGYGYTGSVTSFAGKSITYEAGSQVKSIATGGNVYGYTY